MTEIKVAIKRKGVPVALRKSEASFLCIINLTFEVFTFYFLICCIGKPTRIGYKIRQNKVASITRLQFSNGLKRGYLVPNISLIVIDKLVFAINKI